MLFKQSNDYYDNIRYFTASKVGSYYGMGMPGYSKDTLYKELETEYKNTIKSIEKYEDFISGDMKQEVYQEIHHQQSQ